MFTKVVTFFQEAKQEFRHINWPTRKEAVRLTLVVIGISLGLAVFLGVFDGIFASLLKAFVL
ncbi:MAG: preprotein translocase subunit SecE [bacterium]|nr:preprotein translocase subunit SecE [bacterium]